MEFDANELKGVAIKDGVIFSKPQPQSIIWIGDKHYRTQLPVDQHFNWFQKLMCKLCFGVNIEDYNKE